MRSPTKGAAHAHRPTLRRRLQSLRRNAILSQNQRGVATWEYVRFADSPLAGLRIRVLANEADAEFLGFAMLTHLGVVQMAYLLRDGMRVLWDMRAGW